MTVGETISYRLGEGRATIRIDADSLVYRWTSWNKTFEGTLPYENLHLANRVRGRDADSGAVIALLVPIVTLVGFLVPSERFSLFLAFTAPMLSIAFFNYVRERWFCPTISVEVKPQPFGFYDRLQFPDTPKGLAKLECVEKAWRASLKRRFLDGDSKDPIDWKVARVHAMVNLGVITEEEGEAYRRVLEQSATEGEEVPLLTN